MIVEKNPDVILEFDRRIKALEEGGGSNGLSAYEIWLQQGNEGSEADFLESLKGDPYTLTEEDKAELVTDVLEALPTWEGGSF